MTGIDLDPFTAGALAAFTGLLAGVAKYGLSDEDLANAISAASAKLKEANYRMASGDTNGLDPRFYGGQAKVLSHFLSMTASDASSD